MNYIFCILIGYLLGSIPTAYILLKKHKGIDITQNGSGNVGAMNSYELSNSKATGIIVLLIDMAKGTICVLIIKLLINNEFAYQMLGLSAAVLGHSFSPWIKFKGGRGLATAAGGILLISIPVLIIWILSWLVIKFINGNIHIANFAATLASITLCAVFPERINSFTNPPAQSSAEFAILVSIMFVVILVKHINPLIQIFDEQRKTSRI